MSNYKIIASDVDGTLNNDKHIVSEGNVQAIKKALDAGIKVVLCSGRAPVSLAEYAKKIGLDTKGCYGIGHNGAVVYEADSHNILFETGMDKNVVKEVIKEVKSISDEVLISLFGKGNRILTEKRIPLLKDYKEEDIMDIQIVNNLETAVNEDIIKIIVMGDRKKLDHIYNEVSKLKNNNYNMVFSAEIILEFMPVNTNKAEGIKYLAKHLNVDLKDIAAIGDNYNDIEMVEEVGLGIAIANAVQPLKDVANYITKRNNNEDALIEVVDMVLK